MKEKSFVAHLLYGVFFFPFAIKMFFFFCSFFDEGWTRAICIPFVLAGTIVWCDHILVYLYLYKLFFFSSCFFRLWAKLKLHMQAIKKRLMQIWLGWTSEKRMEEIVLVRCLSFFCFFFFLLLQKILILDSFSRAVFWKKGLLEMLLCVVENNKTQRISDKGLDRTTKKNAICQ